MTNEEAKFLLNAYRPNGQDAADPAFATALAQAKNDPALGAWFAREQAHAAATARKLSEIAPPAGLRDAILAGGRATERASSRPTKWPLSGWLAMAASVAVLAAVSVTLWPKRGATDEMTAFAMNDVLHGRHGGHGVETQALATRLSDPSTHLASGLPVEFKNLEQSGCRTLRVGGHDVLEVCFVRGGAEFHCYICRAADYPDEADGDAVSFVQQAGLTAAEWTKGAYHFVVVGDAGLDAVKRLL